MEKESFETDIIAGVLRENFVAIKVDREERPDIDSVYMTVCQMLTGAGGWPLTIIMTPKQKPFFAGTYFPMNTRYGRSGLLEILSEISGRWNDDRESLLNAGGKIYDYLKKYAQEMPELKEPSKKLLKKAVMQFEENYDIIYGGFGAAPKFPVPHNLYFLLKYGALEKKKSVIEMAGETLVKMYQGGIYDHIGGGFSRYSTDEKWLVPHFEKMLYDNALLILVYSEGYLVTENKLFEKIVRDSIRYVIKELLDESGGFYCGQDADSEGEEGKYYTFTKQEILNVLGREAGEGFCETYHISEEGNFEGKNIPNLLENPRYFFGRLGSQTETEIAFYETDPGEIKIRESKEKLYHYRKERTVLHKDDKCLTSWNAMMIAALSRAGFVFEDSSYLSAAKRAEKFIAEKLTKENGRLMVRYRKGEAAHEGMLDDYAYYSWALLSLYKVTFEVSYLQKAVQIAEHMVRFFWDEKQGGFFLYANDAEQLITRPKETYDGAIPSGNSVAGMVLSDLFLLTADKKWEEYRDKQLLFLAGAAEDYPMAHSAALLAMIPVLYPAAEILCVSKVIDESRFRQLLRKLKTFSYTAIWKSEENKDALEQAALFTKEYLIPEKGEVYYICENGTCHAPFLEEKEVLEYLEGKL